METTITREGGRFALSLPALSEERYVEWVAARAQLEQLARTLTSRRGLLGLVTVALTIARLRAEQARLDGLIADYRATVAR